MNAVFEAIVWWEANYGLSFGYPMPRSAIMNQEGLNLYQYRKQIKELKEKGLIEYTRYMSTTFARVTYRIATWCRGGY